jgi:Capsule polysaccharide biosynthesis protein
MGLEWFPDRFYAHRHPGPAARRLIVALAPIVSRLTPNDKWSLGAHLPAWLRALDAAPADPLPSPKRVFLFSAYRIQFTHDFMIAILMAWRGHKVTVGYLPKLQSPIKPPREDHPSAKPYLSDVFSRIERLSGGRISCLDLSDIPAEDIAVDENTLHAQVVSDTIMYTRRETLDMTDPDTKAAWAYYERQARSSRATATAYLSRHRDDFDLVLIPNGATFETAQFCQVARTLGLPVNTFEKFDFRGVRVLNHGDHFLAFNDMDAAWRQRKTLGYHEEPFRSFAVNRALELLGERRRASTANWGWALQKSPHQTVKETLREAGVDDGKPFVLVCTNVPYDAGYSTLLGLFPSMREWLLQTVRFLLTKTDIHVIVRAHPGEAASYGGKERSEETLAEFRAHERLTLIPGDKAANTYNLIEECQFGVVFSSTTGMEMAMLGKTAVVGATVYYSWRGFTVDSKSTDEYFANLQRLAALQKIPRLDRDAAREAALFHFIFHFVMQWPYPYHKPSNVREIPLRKLVRSAQIERYLPFIDALACTSDEWTVRQKEFIAADGSNHVPVPRRSDRRLIRESTTTLEAI